VVLELPVAYPKKVRLPQVVSHGALLARQTRPSCVRVVVRAQDLLRPRRILLRGPSQGCCTLLDGLRGR
jgi:hypothetical protein